MIVIDVTTLSSVSSFFVGLGRLALRPHISCIWKFLLNQRRCVRFTGRVGEPNLYPGGLHPIPVFLNWFNGGILQLHAQTFSIVLKLMLYIQ